MTTASKNRQITSNSFKPGPLVSVSFFRVCFKYAKVYKMAITHFFVVYSQTTVGAVVKCCHGPNRFFRIHQLLLF